MLFVRLVSIVQIRQLIESRREVWMIITQPAFRSFFFYIEIKRPENVDNFKRKAKWRDACWRKT